MKVRLGIIGGGLMGKELTSAIARWCALDSFPAEVELIAIADPNPKAGVWFNQIKTLHLNTPEYQELLTIRELDAVYAAVPHDLHEKIYCDVLAAGKDLLAEKPFGINLKSAVNIALSARTSGRFVRCSSEFPFFPGAQRVVQAVRSGELGQIIEIRACFWHSSDLDTEKPINWKRQSERCGTAGVMNDLGLHVLHLPLRLGWTPKRVFAQLQNIVPRRPDGHGGSALCDTWDNAILNTDVDIDGHDVPMRLEMKRIAPGEMNTWSIEVMGMQSSIKFSTKEPKTLWVFRREKEQIWQKIDLGHAMQFPVVTGAIFEVGFPDVFLQMLAAYIAERGGFLDGRFGCATPEEAVASHELFAAAQRSVEQGSAIAL